MKLWNRSVLLVRLALRHWREDHCSLIAAGLAYYTVISVVPLFILAMALGSQLLGPAASMKRLAPPVEFVVGSQVARPLETLIQQASKRSLKGATLASVGVLLWVASIMFMNLERALNLVWSCPAPSGFRQFLRRRLKAFSMVMGVGLLVAVFALLNAGMGFAKGHLHPLAPVLERYPFWRVMNLGLFFGSLMGFWGMVYRFLPALKLEWRDVWVGSFVTSSLVTGGLYALSFYLSHVKFLSVYGAVTSVLVVLVWIYFTLQIFLLGAEFTWAWAHRRSLWEPLNKSPV